jgi:hypothetical protein
MKRLVGVCACVLLVGSVAGDEPSQETFTKTAARMVKAINAADYDGLRKEFSDEMSREFSADKTKKFFTDLSRSFGKINKLDPPKMDSPSMAVFIARCERGTLDFTLVLDTRGRVAGMRFLPHSETSALKQNETRLTLPFKGKWLVIWGGDTAEQNHHHDSLAQRFAFDLLGAGPGDKTQKGTGTHNEDYFAFGREVLAPADGVVTEAIDGVRDNTPGSMNPFCALGNAVLIRHSPKEVSVLAHLKQGSVKVKAGDHVTRGQVLGLCGNSGNSSEPHLHYHLQNIPVIQDATGIKCFFVTAAVSKDGGKEIRVRYSPVKGDIISPE